MSVFSGKRFRTDEIAKLWNVSTRTVIREIQRGNLVAVRVGRVLRVREEDLLEYEGKYLTHPERIKVER